MSVYIWLTILRTNICLSENIVNNVCLIDSIVDKVCLIDNIANNIYLIDNIVNTICLIDDIVNNASVINNKVNIVFMINNLSIKSTSMQYTTLRTSLALLPNDIAFRRSGTTQNYEYTCISRQQLNILFIYYCRFQGFLWHPRLNVLFSFFTDRSTSTINSTRGILCCRGRMTLPCSNLDGMYEYG